MKSKLKKLKKELISNGAENVVISKLAINGFTDSFWFGNESVLSFKYNHHNFEIKGVGGTILKDKKNGKNEIIINRVGESNKVVQNKQTLLRAIKKGEVIVSSNARFELFCLEKNDKPVEKKRIFPWFESFLSSEKLIDEAQFLIN